MLNANSQCPGGRNKRIKDCCPELLKPLNQIYEMLDGKQYSACLAAIERLEVNHPDCDGLLMAKGITYSGMDKNDDCISIMLKLVERNPKNHNALFRLCLALFAKNEFDIAYHYLINMIECNDTNVIEIEDISIILKISRILITNKYYLQASVLLHPLNRCKDIPKEVHEEVYELMEAILNDTSIQPIFKDIFIGKPFPDDFQEKEKYAKACFLMTVCHFNEAKVLLDELEPLARSWSEIYLALAKNAFVLFDFEKGIEYLKQYAAQDCKGASEEDRKDALMQARYFEGTLWGDDIVLVDPVWTINDFNSVVETLLSASDYINIPYDMSQLQTSDKMPPQKVFGKLDRPQIRWQSGDGIIDPKDLPLLQTNVLLFGRRTDREAQIQFMDVPESEVEKIEQHLRELLGAKLGSYEGIGSTEENDRKLISETFRMMNCNYYYPKNYPVTKKEYYDSICWYQKNVFCAQWIDHPLGILNGKTPREAVKDDSLRIQLQAALHYFSVIFIEPNYNKDTVSTLRQLLDLPEPGFYPVDENDKCKATLDIINIHPAWQWDRIDFSPLTPDLIDLYFQLSYQLRVETVYVKLAKQILTRPFTKESFELRGICYQAIIHTLIERQDIDQELPHWFEEIYKECKLAGVSDGHWNLLELNYALYNPNYAERLRELIQYIVDNHQNEPEIMEATSQIIQHAEQMLRKNRASAVPQNAAPASEAHEPEKTTGLWTPDSPNNSDTNHGSKLWVPGE